MQMLRSGQHFRVYGGNLHQRQFQHIPRTIQGVAQGCEKGLHRLSVERGGANLLERDFESNHLTTIKGQGYENDSTFQENDTSLFGTEGI